MRIIITGHKGYIGTFLQKRILKEIETLFLDIKTGDDITKSLSKYKSFEPDIVFHLAAITSVEESFRNPEKVFKTNVEGTMNILRLGGKIIFPSSATVYGDRLLAKEEDDLSPQSPYAESKVKAEKCIENSGHRFAILRLGNVYGGVPTRVIKALKEGGKIFGGGTHLRDYVHIDDALDAFIEAMTWENGIYNIGTGIAVSVNEIADMLGVEKKYAPRVEEQKFISLDISKAEKMGWKPKRKLKDYLISL